MKDKFKKVLEDHGVEATDVLLKDLDQVISDEIDDIAEGIGGKF